MRAWLRNDGLYMVNMIDGDGDSFGRGYVRTLMRAFPLVCLAPTNGEQLWHASRTTFVALADDEPLDLAALANIDGGDKDALASAG